MSPKTTPRAPSTAVQERVLPPSPWTCASAVAVMRSQSRWHPQDARAELIEFEPLSCLRIESRADPPALAAEGQGPQAPERGAPWVSKSPGYALERMRFTFDAQRRCRCLPSMGTWVFRGASLSPAGYVRTE